IFKKADQANAILKRSIQDLSGIDVKAYRSVRGSPYVKDGPVRFGLVAPVFDYACRPMSSYQPDVRGTIALSDETSTWINIYFNAIPQDFITTAAHTANGAKIYKMPKRSDVTDRYQLLVPDRHDGFLEEMIIITPDGQLPFKPVSRERYLLGRQK